MNILAQQFEGSAIDQAITWLCVAPVQIAIGVSWEVGKLSLAVAKVGLAVLKVAAIVLAWLMSALAENWKPLAKLAAIVVAVAIMAMVWQIGIGVGVVVLLTMVMRKKGKI